MTQPARVTAFSFCLCYRRPNHLNALRFTLGIFSGKIFFYCKQASPAELACLLFHRKSCFSCRERSRGTGFIAFIKIIAAGDAPLGQRQGGVFRVPPPYLWTPPSPQRERGCSPLVTPKLLGSIQKIQVASLKDFLCSADWKPLSRCATAPPSGSKRTRKRCGLPGNFAVMPRALPLGELASPTGLD